MPVKRRLSGSEFDAVRPLLGISDERIEAARSAMVDGDGLQTIGDRYGWSKQSVGDAVAVVWKAFERYREAQQIEAQTKTLIPAGWEQVTLVAPVELVARFRAELAQIPMPKTAKKAKPKTNKIGNKKPGK